MTAASANAKAFLNCLNASQTETSPYRHWLLADVFTERVCKRILDLPFSPPEGTYAAGTREANNASRVYFNADNCARFAVCGDVVATLQHAQVRRQIEKKCGIDLSEGLLRIEYTQDREGFWLEPHTDISVKLFTMLVYLSPETEAASLGTDVYDKDFNLVKTAPFRFNHGLLFIPAGDTWHGFRPRPFACIRRSIIVNYVSHAWQERHELAPVTP